MIRWFKKELDWIALGILFICCLPLFVNLGTAPIYMWDEATYANNSIDMYLYHDPIVVRMEGEPDLYNTKPPFVPWMQTLSMQIFGMNEFAIRLPSAVLSALTMLLLLLFSIKVLHSYQIGFISILTLACSNGYVSNHGARSGDLDASLVFWTTLYVLACIKFLIERKEIAIHLAFFSLGVIGAFLSKGVAGYFFLPFLVIIALINRNLTSIIKEKIFYISIITIVTVCGGYYLLREQAAAGYWDVIIQSELSRYGKAVMSWHVQPFRYYLMNLVSHRFIPFIFLLPLSILVPILSRNSILEKVLLFLWILAIGYFLLISFPPDKLPWYDEPLYPFFSLIVGISLLPILEKLTSLMKTEKRRLRDLVSCFLIVLLFLFPYKKTISRVTATDPICVEGDTSMIDYFRIHGAYMKYLHQHVPEFTQYSIFKTLPADREHEDQIKFYQRTYHLNYNYVIKIKYTLRDLKTGEFVLVYEKEKLDSLLNSFDVSLINSWNGCEFVLLKNKVQ